MLSKVDQLLNAYEAVVNEPWSTSLSGHERIWFLVYDPIEQRKVDLRIGDFETLTIKANKKWISVSLKNCFPTWMSNHDYKEDYFTDLYLCLSIRNKIFNLKQQNHERIKH